MCVCRQNIKASPPPPLAPENSGATPLACSNIGLEMNIPGSVSGKSHTRNDLTRRRCCFCALAREAIYRDQD
jgi:hypothetical protein